MITVKFKQTTEIEWKKCSKGRLKEENIEIEAYMNAVRYDGLYFCARSVWDYSWAESVNYRPPFKELQDPFRTLAISSWKGEIISDGIWVKDKDLMIPKESEFHNGCGDSSLLGTYEDPYAVFCTKFVQKKARLIGSKEKEGGKIYENEEWEIIYKTPFGVFSRGEKIITSNDEMAPGAYHLDYGKRMRWRKLILDSDVRIPCQFCFSPKGEKMEFHAVWTEVIEGHGHGARDSMFPRSEVVEFKICPDCVKKGLEGNLSTVGIWHYEKIKLIKTR